jgi:ATP-dependent helicase HrpA
MVITGFPSLVDEGETVALRVLPSEAEQRSSMWRGTRRLLLLHIGSPLRTLDKALSNPTKLALAASRHVTAAEVYVEATAAAVDQLLITAGGPVWDEELFDGLATSAKTRFAAVAEGAATIVGEVVATVTRIEDRLGTMLTASLDDTVLDVQAHLGRLLHRGWITAAGVERLPDVLRYVQGIEHRLDKAIAQPERDRSRAKALQALEGEYRAVASRDLDGHVRWMLEELRVSTFAQKVGAKGGASEQKVRAELAHLG